MCLSICLKNVSTVAFSAITDAVPYFFFFYIYNLHFFEQKIYSHQVLIYLNVPEIPFKRPLQNRQIVEEQLDV